MVNEERKRLGGGQRKCVAVCVSEWMVMVMMDGAARKKRDKRMAANLSAWELPYLFVLVVVVL